MRATANESCVQANHRRSASRKGGLWDIFKSDSTVFKVEDGNIRLPFVAVDKLGETVAEGIVQARNEQAFTSKADVLKRTKLNSSLFDEFNIMHVFGSLPDEDKEKEVGLFAFEF